MHIDRQRPQIFYGWWIVFSTSAVMLYTSGIVHFGFTAVFEPIADEFGWSYTQISLAASLRGLETGLLAPVVGLLVDRWGPKKLIFFGCSVTGLGLILLSQVNSLLMFYGAFIIISIGGSFTSHTVTMSAVSNWFRRRLAMASGIMASGAALGGILIPVIVILIDGLGWRTALFFLGLGTWVICLPLSLLVRDNPEKYGYLPDGDNRETAVTADSPAKPARRVDLNFTAGEALKNRAFWHIAVAMSLHALIMSAILTHVMPYLSSIGISRGISSVVATAIPVASILGRLSFGWLGDKLEMRRVAAAGFVLLALGLILFAYIDTLGLWLLAPFLIIFGIGFGGNVTMRTVLLNRYFGRESFGSILGIAIGLMTVGSIIGAPLAGWMFDHWHSYRIAWLALAALSCVSIFIIMAAAPPAPAKVSGCARPNRPPDQDRNAR